MSGKILTQLLEAVGLSRKDIYITNTIICRPPNNRNPSKDEIKNCRERLDRLLQVMQPTVIVTIGNFATDRIIGKTGIKSIHGQKFPATIAGQKVTVVPVVHPAAWLYSGRNPELFEQMKADFQTIANLVDAKKLQMSLSDY
jgi:uracil-DNA glycosylase